MTACGKSSNPGGVPGTYILLLQRLVMEITAKLFHRLFTLSFSDYKEQGLDVKEHKYGLNTKLGRGTTL